MEISVEDARLIAKAFRVVNDKYAGELQRILHSDESDYIKDAAVKQYNTDAEAYSELHVRMAQAFPELTQR